MGPMVKPIAAAVALSFTLCLPAFAQAPAGPKASPGPLQTLPPEITHVYSRPLCNTLRRRIGPAVGMILQNDQTIAKGPDLFNEYNRRISNESAGRNMTLLRMENLVGPIADNIIAIKKLLEDKDAFPDRPRNEDDIKALQLKEHLLNTVAAQEASLDIINGFVTTQQLGDMQHEGFGYIGAITGSSEITKNRNPMQTPAPGLSDPNYAGLAPDPHTIDLASIPGLSVGYNPITRLRDGLQWVRGTTTNRESVAAAPLLQVATDCGAAPAASPAPH